MPRRTIIKAPRRRRGRSARASTSPVFRFRRDRAAFLQETFHGVARLLD